MSLAILAVFCILLVLFILQFRPRRIVVVRGGPELRVAQVQYRAGLVIMLAMGFAALMPWYAACESSKFDWDPGDVSSMQIEEYSYVDLTPLKTRSLKISDRAEIEKMLESVASIKATPGSNHEPVPGKEFVVRLFRRSGIESAYSISIQFARDGTSYSGNRGHLLSVQLNSSSLYHGEFGCEALVQLIRQRLESPRVNQPD